jgi:putative transferase (TIGR04331 family)
LWDPAYCELNNSAQPYFDELREAGILFDNPESAASHVNEIYQDPMSWWKTEKIQKTRKRFCKQYVRFESDWVTIWKNEILKVVNE